MAHVFNKILKNIYLYSAWERLNCVIQWVLTFITINILWVLFKADTITSALLFIKKMFCLSTYNIREEIYQCFDLIEVLFLEEKIPFLYYLMSAIKGFNLWIFICGAFFIVTNFRNSKEIEFRPTITKALITIVFMVWYVLSFAEVSAFLYFDF